jgi:hypothetical protein
MKLPKSIQIKDTTRLFSGKYKYKLVLVTPVAYLLRSKNFDLAKNKVVDMEYNLWSRIKNLDQQNYFIAVCNTLKKYQNEFDIRVENPRVSVYTNNTKLVEELSNIDSDNVKFIVMPNNKNPSIESGSVLVKRLDFNFKVHVAATRINHVNFVEWSKNNPKIRMPRRCSVDLSRDRSWGGSYFYVKDDKTLTMVKMFLGSDIGRVETVIKA